MNSQIGTVALIKIENIYTFYCSVCAALSLWSQSYARQILMRQSLFDPRGSRQMDMPTCPLGSLPAGIKNLSWEARLLHAPPRKGLVIFLCTIIGRNQKKPGDSSGISPGSSAVPRPDPSVQPVSYRYEISYDGHLLSFLSP